MSATVTPLVPLRIRRDTAWQRAYLPRLRRTVNELARWSRLTDERRQPALDRRLAPLRRALWRSPWWCERLVSLGLSPADLRTLDHLPAFPVLERDTLRDHGGDLVSHPAPDLVAVRSSGSTGQPVTVYRDAWETLHMWAVLRFFCDHLGIDPGPRPRVVLLCSLPIGLAYSARLPLLGDGALHRIAIARGDAAERLRRVRPAAVFSDPAGLHWLARQDVPAPRLLLSSAQHLWPDLRHELAQRFRAPVVDYWSTTETGPIAWDCGRGAFHVLLPEVWVESVGGELLVTRLRRSPWPLLRYRTGDRGRVVTGDCECGHRGFSVIDLAGRRRVAFVRPDGSLADAWQLAWVFKHVGLDAFRLTQTAPTGFRLEIATTGEPVPDLSVLREALARLGWPHAEIAVRKVPHLASAGHKPEPFVCALALEGGTSNSRT